MVTKHRKIRWIWDSTFGMYCLFSIIFLGEILATIKIQ